MKILNKLVYYKNGVFWKKSSNFQKRPYLDYLLINLVDHCNLGCKGCDHFAPLAKPRFEKVNQLKEDLTKISELINHKDIVIFFSRRRATTTS